MRRLALASLLLTCFGCFKASDDPNADEATSDVASETAEASCPIGSEACPCTVGGSCDNGLVCLSGICVDNSAESSSDSSDSGDSSDSPQECGAVSIEVTYVPPNVMLLVDASSSMISNLWDHDLDLITPEVTRWNTLYTVVGVVMNNFAGTLNAGIQRFPSSDACPDATPSSSNCYNVDACLVNSTPEVGVAFDNAAAILGAIPGANANNVEVVGATPATAGFSSSRDHLLSQPAGIPNYVLLITDGAANCVDGLPFPDFIETYDSNLQLEVGKAFTVNNIPTFVVGIDILDALVGSGNDGAPFANAYDELNEVAIAGGFPKNMGLDPDKFFNTTNQTELLDAIEGILGEVIDCSIDLTMTQEGPPDPQQVPYVAFEADSVELSLVLDCAAEDGWAWVVVGEIMTFCGSYCEDFKNGTAAFDGTYGCPSD